MRQAIIRARSLPFDETDVLLVVSESTVMPAADDLRASALTAAQSYADACRSRIPEYVDRHFSLRGTLALQRHTLAGDLWRAPLNTLFAVPSAWISSHTGDVYNVAPRHVLPRWPASRSTGPGGTECFPEPAAE